MIYDGMEGSSSDFTPESCLSDQILVRGKQNIGYFVKPSRQESRGLPHRGSYTEVEPDESYKSGIRVCGVVIRAFTVLCIWLRGRT